MNQVNGNWPENLRDILQRKKEELNARLERVKANVRRGYETDSKERAQQLAGKEVIDALGNEAREEVAKISIALQRMDSGNFGLCSNCGSPISVNRIKAYPYATECIDCASIDEKYRATLIRSAAI